MDIELKGMNNNETEDENFEEIPFEHSDECPC